ncbi:hypothetical protein L484_019204 [Morus notabilis]|uniref:Uncharacterized protein n=1 Tax=Morus notabilis TaxID=981085 RepID=W9QR94_9ROSA|nr:hypothetical protein L484_019204 [Morus notabilis]
MLEIFVEINKKENDIFFGCNEIINDAKFDMTSLNEIKGYVDECKTCKEYHR